MRKSKISSSDIFVIVLVSLVATAMAAMLALLAMMVDWAELMKHKPERIVAAGLSVLGAAFTAGGAIYLWKAQERSAARKEADDRVTRIRRTISALHAELKVEIRDLRQSFDPRRNHALFERHRQLVAEGEFPVWISYREKLVFSQNKHILTEVPEVLAEAIVEFHKNDAGLNRFIEAAARGRFNDMKEDRRLRALEAFRLMGARALAAALEEHALLEQHRKGDAPIRRDTAVETYLTEDEAELLDALKAEHAKFEGRD